MDEQFDNFFVEERYTDNSLNYEDEYTDRKAILHNLVSQKQSKKAFVKDFIALANMSYRFGRITRILFGIGDDKQLIGVSERFEGQNNDFDDFLKNEKGNVEKAITRYARLMLKIIKDYIKPYPGVHFRFKHGWIKEKLFIYLEIKAEPNPRLFETKETDDRVEKLFEENQAWKRIGEDTVLMETEDEKNNWVAWTECPIIEASRWKEYFNRLTSKKFLEAHLLPGYQELYTLDGHLLINVVNEFLEASDRNMLVIEGNAGFGKTSFLRRLIYTIAENASQYPISGFLVEPPFRYVPVYTEMWENNFKSSKKLEKFILEWWNVDNIFNISGIEKNNPLRLLSLSGYTWIVCIDAVDECGTPINHFLEKLNELCEEKPQIKIILTSRPDTVSTQWRENQLVTTISPLSNAQVQEYIYFKVPRSEVCLNTLEAYPQLQDMVKNPLYLFAFCKRFSDEQIEPVEYIDKISFSSPPVDIQEGIVSIGSFLDGVEQNIIQSNLDANNEGKQNDDYSSGNENLEIEQSEPLPFLSDLLNDIFDYVLRHEQKHLQKLGKITANSEQQLSLQTFAVVVDGNERSSFDDAKRILKKHFLDRLLSVGLLISVHDYISFQYQPIQIFLAAKYLNYYGMCRKIEKIKRICYQDNRFWKETYQLFVEICHDANLINLVSQFISSISKEAQ